MEGRLKIRPGKVAIGLLVLFAVGAALRLFKTPL